MKWASYIATFDGQEKCIVIRDKSISWYQTQLLVKALVE